MEFDRELDTRGLLCPLPVLKTKLAMDSMPAGRVLKVVSTDAGSVRDMHAYARQTRNPLIHEQVDGAEYIFFLRKGGADAG